MIAPHAIQRHPSNAQPRLRVLHSGCRRACWAMMMRQARRSSAIQHYTVRCGFLSQRSYVAPSRQRRSSSKRPRKELTYCPIYGFKSFLICAKELTPALFCVQGLQPCTRSMQRQRQKPELAFCWLGGAMWVGRTVGAMDGAIEPPRMGLRRVLPTHMAPPNQQKASSGF